LLLLQGTGEIYASNFRLHKKSLSINLQ